jgi:hypothetical protein
MSELIARATRTRIEMRHGRLTEITVVGWEWLAANGVRMFDTSRAYALQQAAAFVDSLDDDRPPVIGDPPTGAGATW